MISLICELKYDISETNKSIQRKDLLLARGMEWGRDGWGVSDQQVQIIIYRMAKQQGPTGYI